MKKGGSAYDFIVLGGGAAGFAAAMQAHAMGKKTLMVNDSRVGLGGTCVNVGCLPTKHLLHVADLIQKARNNPYQGVSSKADVDFAKVMAQKDALVTGMRKEKYAKVLDKLSNVDLVKGTACFVSRNEIAVGKKRFKGKKFLLATGSSTFVPPIKGLKEAGFLTNITALKLKNPPKRLAIIGSGALGLEFGQFFSRMGSRVSMFERAHRLLPNSEPDLAGLLQKYLENEGITFHLEASIQNVEKTNNAKALYFSESGRERKTTVDEILLAAGRAANTQGLEVEKAGVETDAKGAPKVNALLQTTNPNVYAAGDIIGEPMLETIAAKEGKTAAQNAFSEKPMKMDYAVVPRAIFTSPEFSTVGLSDAQANQAGHVCACRTISLSLVPKAQAVLDTKGAVKVVAESKTGKILGISILSSHAADLIHEAAMIVRNGMTVGDVVDTVHVFPTLSEGIKIACQAFFRNVRDMSCCVE